jgi:hypothetical protein
VLSQVRLLVACVWVGQLALMIAVNADHADVGTDSVTPPRSVVSRTMTFPAADAASAQLPFSALYVDLRQSIGLPPD